MMKKITIPVVSALILALIVCSVAFAGDDPPPKKNQFVYGEVVVIDKISFTVQSFRESRDVTYGVNEETIFHESKFGGMISFLDLTIGAKVAVHGQSNDVGQMIGQRVLLLPDEFNPMVLFSLRVRGQIDSIDPDTKNFSLRLRNGKSVIFTLIEKTRFIGQDRNLSDLQIGQNVIVVGKLRDDAPALAAVIVTHVRNTPKRYAGVITDVKPFSEIFILSTQQGDEMTFIVSEKTKFTSPNNEIQSLSDMQTGMLAIVLTVTENDGIATATHIGIGNKDDIPKFEIKAVGQISALGADFLTIQTRRDEMLVFQITSETKFRGRSGPDSLDDLEMGMNIFIGGQELEAGELLAQWIIIGKEATP
ncbi:MAG: hypothetical protein IMY76_09090 [Chloroflexi bacterium]|nr:hypothetical protein [Chloroflexota bacterium]